MMTSCDHCDVFEYSRVCCHIQYFGKLQLSVLVNSAFSGSHTHQNTEDLYDHYRICIGGDVGVGVGLGFVHLDLWSEIKMEKMYNKHLRL
jgi:hypothetical protein